MEVKGDEWEGGLNVQRNNNLNLVIANTLGIFDATVL